MTISALLPIIFGVITALANPVEIPNHAKDLQIRRPKDSNITYCNAARIDYPSHTRQLWEGLESIDAPINQSTSAVRIVRHILDDVAIYCLPRTTDGPACHVCETSVASSTKTGSSQKPEADDTRNLFSASELCCSLDHNHDQDVSNSQKNDIPLDQVLPYDANVGVRSGALGIASNSFCCWIQGLLPTQYCSLCNEQHLLLKIRSSKEKQRICCWANGLQVFGCHLCPASSSQAGENGLELWEATEVNGYIVKFIKRSTDVSVSYSNNDICCVGPECEFCTLQNREYAEVWNLVADMGRGNYRYRKSQASRDAGVYESEALCCFILGPIPFCVPCPSATSATAAKLPVAIATCTRSRDVQTIPQEKAQCCLIVHQDLICDLCPTSGKPLSVLENATIDEFDMALPACTNPNSTRQKKRQNCTSDLNLVI